MADEQTEALISGLSEAEAVAFDALRKCLWVIYPTEESKNWDGTDIGAWKNDGISRDSAAVLMDAIKRAGLTISYSWLPYESPIKATPEDTENWEKAYQADPANRC